MSGSETERIIKIINAVKKQECLWNVNSYDYAKREKLVIAWNEVAQEIGISDAFCREKWRNVRTGFLRSIQHQIRISSDESVSSDYLTVKRKRFYLHDQMAFLLPSAVSLELARKKRKLSRTKTHDMLGMEDYDDTLDYNIVCKSEHHNCNDEEKIYNDEAEEEHHSFEAYANAAADNDNDDVGNIDDDDINEILKVTEVMHRSGATKQTSKQEDQHQQLVAQQSAAEHLSAKDPYSPTTDKVMSLTSQQLNEEINTTPSNVNSNSSPRHNTNQQSECIFLSSTSSSQRDEQLLLHFFRGCIDDILALDKQKQRLFKRHMLDLIVELHNS